MALPEPLAENRSIVNRWIKLKAIHQQFVIRWKEDYLKSLQKRYKWKRSTPNLKAGDFVVVVDDLLPPSEWRLGRIVTKQYGSDSRVRVADIKTSAGIFKRSVVKLCYLPLIDSDS